MIGCVWSVFGGQFLLIIEFGFKKQRSSIFEHVADLLVLEWHILWQHLEPQTYGFNVIKNFHIESVTLFVSKKKTDFVHFTSVRFNAQYLTIKVFDNRKVTCIALSYCVMEVGPIVLFLYHTERNRAFPTQRRSVYAVQIFKARNVSF